MTPKHFAQAALIAYRSGRLAAQAPKPKCAYRTRQRGIVYACGIGAGLPNKLANKVIRAGLNSRPVDELVEFGRDFIQNGQLYQLQSAHDRWANMAAVWAASSAVSKAESDFLALALRLSNES